MFGCEGIRHMEASDVFAVLTQALIYGLPLLIAITLHEAAHGYAAYARGDGTAKMAGRLSLNPLRHIDPFGTVLLPASLIFIQSPFVFGYAKPVPVNFDALKNPRFDMMWVALAGPLTNLGLAIVSALLFYTAPYFEEVTQGIVVQMLSFSLMINVLLAVFNMIPLPPLDGGRVAVALLPRVLAMPLARLERWGFAIVVGGFMVLPLILGKAGIQFSLFDVLLKEPMAWIIHLITTWTGIAG